MSPFFTLPFPLARTRARQEVFVFILHLFTGMPQIVVAQHIRGEGFFVFRFTVVMDGVHRGDKWNSLWMKSGGFG